jgi:hypothetical protein
LYLKKILHNISGEGGVETWAMLVGIRERGKMCTKLVIFQLKK